jgi:RimJ/RimL family protein N-acetyltransferase
MEEVSLRALTDDDLPTLFAFSSDPVSVAMAGMPLRDEEAFAAPRARTMANPQNVLRGITVDGALAGDLGSWPDEHGRRKVGYWVDRDYWGRGIATAALTAFLAEITERPLYADVLRTNAASLRVLHKCGFRLLDDGEPGADHGPEEYALRLGQDPVGPSEEA